MKTKHTPGPWRAVRNSAYWEVVPANAGKDGVPFTIGDVCASAPREPDAGLQKANARLIAAAPELLAALEMIATQKREGDIPQQVVRMQRIARAAIAKATGHD